MTLYDRLSEEQKKVLTDGSISYPLGIANLTKTLREKEFVLDLTLGEVSTLSSWFGGNSDVSGMYKIFNK